MDKRYRLRFFLRRAGAGWVGGGGSSAGLIGEASLTFCAHCESSAAISGVSSLLLTAFPRRKKRQGLTPAAVIVVSAVA